MQDLDEKVCSCDACGGKGIFYGRGTVVNGVFKGYSGDCFRCGGKGYQTRRDMRRNRYYDRNIRRVSA